MELFLEHSCKILLLAAYIILLYTSTDLKTESHSNKRKICNVILFLEVQSVQEKFVFFTIHCKPSLAYIAVSFKCNAKVQSLLLAANFLYNQWQPSAGEGEVANFREFLEKNTIINEHPVAPKRRKLVI